MLRLGNIARLELNYCVPMGVQSGDRYTGSHWYWPLHWFSLVLARKKVMHFYSTIHFF